MAVNPDDDVPASVEQRFVTERSPAEALDAAEVYLEGAGIVATPLQGELERSGNGLVVHHGRITTTIRTDRPQSGHGTEVVIRRRGRGPLEDTRRWLFVIGFGGFLLGWGLAWYNSRAQDALPPLVTMTLFFLGLLGFIVLLFVVDRSLEHRSGSIIASLEDAVRGDPVVVLQREIDGLERSSSIANGVLFYCASLFVEFIAFAITLDVGTAVDRAIALDIMPASFGLPIIPAVLFGLIWFASINRIHATRMQLVKRRLDSKIQD